MARPPKVSDPITFPDACARCGEHHQVAARWADGAVCGYCYQRAKRTRGTCACGHVGVLPGMIDGLPACRACAGVKLNIDCRTCGAEDELYDGSRCWTCVLATTVDRLLTNPATGTISAELSVMAEALKSMERANSGLTWIRQPHVTSFLAHLAVAPAITHEALDELPASGTRDYVRGLLVEHGALPRRDELLARFTAWSDQSLDRLPAGEHRDVVRRFIRWHLLRRMNGSPGAVTQGTFLRSKQTTTVTIDFLIWLTARGTTLSQLTQADLDAWQAGGPTTREVASRFLAWAIKAHLVDPNLRMQPHRRGTAHKLSSAEQTAAVQAIVHHHDLTPRDQLAAILVLVLGQQIEDVVRLTWDNTTVTDDLATITLGTAPITVPHRSMNPCANSSPSLGMAARPRTPTPRGSSGVTPPAATSARRTCASASRPSAPPGPPGWAPSPT